MVQISKEYQICYAHRLLNHQGKCARLHGHNGQVTVSIDGEVEESLYSPRNGMVLDFEDLDIGVGKWLNEYLDHRTILEIGDPLINAMIDCNEGESLLVIDRAPTAELLAMFILARVKDWIAIYKGEFKVSVTFWETSKAYAMVDESSNFIKVSVDSEGDLYVTAKKL
jgi:6-pyruvoyltetrahydropterin/6-carboxytetrahydropterin synthase